MYSIFNNVGNFNEYFKSLVCLNNIEHTIKGYYIYIFKLLKSY